MDQKCFMGFSVSFSWEFTRFFVSYHIRRFLKADVMRLFGSMFEIGVPAIVKGNPRTRPFDSFLKREPDVQRMPESKFGTWPTTMSWTKPPPLRGLDSGTVSSLHLFHSISGLTMEGRFVFLPYRA